MGELSLLLPDLAQLKARVPAAVPAAWLARGDRLADAIPGRDTVLRESFEFTGTAIPSAALTRSLDAADAAGSLWLRADPAWVMADAVTLRLLACGNMDLSASDSDQLARALKPLFGDAGFLLEPATPSRWYLRCPAGAQLPAFSAPRAALGDDIARHLPEGESGRRWRHLSNEAQVILHNHPVNAERSRRGAAPVNSLWFWGAGRLPDWVRTAFAVAMSNDEIVLALARLAGIPVAGTLAEALGAATGDARVIVDLDGPMSIITPEGAWAESMQKALADRSVAQVELKFASGERYRYRHGHRWRFWRRIPLTRTA
jgi:hypothetical protein